MTIRNELILHVSKDLQHNNYTSLFYKRTHGLASGGNFAGPAPKFSTGFTRPIVVIRSTTVTSFVLGVLLYMYWLIKLPPFER